MKCVYCGLPAGEHDEHDACVEASAARALDPAYVEPPGPWPGDEVLVDCTAYGVPGTHWCLVVRRLGSWSAAVYPLKVQIPERGIGQYKLEEVRACRTPDSVALMLVEVETMTGKPVDRTADGYTVGF